MSAPVSDAVAGAKALVVDVGGVFVVPEPDVVRAVLGAAPATRSATELHDGAFVDAHYHGVAAYDRAEERPERWSAYLDAYTRALGLEPGAAAEVMAELVELWASPSLGLWTRVVDHNRLALIEAADRWPVAVVSNSDGNIAEILAMTRVAQVGSGSGADVVTIVDSGDLGIHKPDPRCFAPALSVLAEQGIGPGECVYVGDSFRNDVEGSRAAGMIAVHLDPLGLGPPGSHARVTSLAELVAALASP